MIQATGSSMILDKGDSMTFFPFEGSNGWEQGNDEERVHGLVDTGCRQGDNRDDNEDAADDDHDDDTGCRKGDVRCDQSVDDEKIYNHVLQPLIKQKLTAKI